MRIRVIHRDGDQEVLTVVGPLIVTETNRENGMSHFQDATGTDFYFNDSDGTYDGFARACSEVAGFQDAMDRIESVQSAREFVEPILPTVRE